jgi:hypothetical protein
MTKRPVVTGLVIAAVIIAGIVVVSVALSGGSGSNSASTVSTEPTTVIPYSPGANAREDVFSDLPCTSSNGAWTLSGTITNSKNVSRTYQLVVDFVTSTGGTVLFERVQTFPSVTPGQKINWHSSWQSNATSVACVLVSARAKTAS